MEDLEFGIAAVVDEVRVAVKRSGLP